MQRLHFALCLGLYGAVALQPIVRPRGSHPPHPKRWTLSHSDRTADASETESVSASFGIPTLEQLRSDPFMSQVRHAEFIVGLLHEDDHRQTDVVMRRLRAQLSHADGQRGFMVTFLTTQPVTETTTTDPDTPTTGTTIPRALVTVVTELLENATDTSLLNLLYMNVIMPTAMVTLHTDVTLSRQSALTAHVATRLLHAVGSTMRSNDTTQVWHPARAIVAAAAATTDQETTVDDAILYWRNFLDQYGYQTRQRDDIARAMTSILNE